MALTEDACAFNWIVCRFDMTDPKGLIAWLDNYHAIQFNGKDIASLLGTEVPELDQIKGSVCTLESTFVVDGSLLIRSGSGKSNAPDFVQLHSKRDDQDVPVISGTSLAGALRARALRISKTLGKDGHKVADNVFGNRICEDNHKELTASRLWIDEAIIRNPLDLVHSRIKIDRFTGGAFPSALFSEQPVFGKLSGETIVKISLKLEDANNGDVGLLLLLLKDLWTGDLPIGGESSVGRGRLRGKLAIMSFGGDSWLFSQEGDKVLQIDGDKAKLEEFVHEFVEVS